MNSHALQDTTTTPHGNAFLTEVVLPGVVEPGGVVVRQRPVPEPGEGQVLVEMLATGVSFAENAMRRNRYPGQPKFPFVLGYDLVGRVSGVGPGGEPALLGRTVATVTKTGGWTTHALVDAADVVTVPSGIDPAEAETVLLNGITAWQMLHRSAKVRSGRTILVHGASGGVGMILAQLARHDGIRVIGTGSPRHHDALRAIGVEPLDYHDDDLAEQIATLAPNGVDAVFDNIGGPSFNRSFAQLARGGTLVGYGTAGQLDDTDGMIVAFAKILSRFAWWAVVPNGRRAVFYNFWAGHKLRPRRFRERLAADLTQVFGLLGAGAIEAQIAVRLPLVEAGRALELADTRAVTGKVILHP